MLADSRENVQKVIPESFYHQEKTTALLKSVVYYDNSIFRKAFNSFRVHSSSTDSVRSSDVAYYILDAFVVDHVDYNDRIVVLVRRSTGLSLDQQCGLYST